MITLPPEFKKARMASLDSDHSEFKIGAAVFWKSRFLASGCNLLRTHPSTHNSWFKTLHAEVNAVIQAKNRKFDIDKLTVYVYRATKGGDIVMAKPCSMCMSIMKAHGVKRVYYTTDGGWAMLKI